MKVSTSHRTYCNPKCVQFAAVILDINFQFFAFLSCLMSEFFNSEHATADKSGLKV